MELRVFHDRIFGKYENQLFTFEPTWDSFRPIERVGWDGERFSVVDSKYKSDLFDKNYGYGSLEIKALCRKLIQEIELESAVEIKDPIAFWKWCGEKEVKWWNDRACVFSNQCISKDSISWRRYLHYLNVRAKTLRQPLFGRRYTRRLVPK